MLSILCICVYKYIYKNVYSFSFYPIPLEFATQWRKVMRRQSTGASQPAIDLVLGYPHTVSPSCTTFGIVNQKEKEIFFFWLNDATHHSLIGRIYIKREETNVEGKTVIQLMECACKRRESLMNSENKEERGGHATW